MTLTPSKGSPDVRPTTVLPHPGGWRRSNAAAHADAHADARADVDANADAVRDAATRSPIRTAAHAASDAAARSADGSAHSSKHRMVCPRHAASRRRLRPSPDAQRDTAR